MALNSLLDTCDYLDHALIRYQPSLNSLLDTWTFTVLVAMKTYPLNSLLDTCEGIYSCYIRLGGIYLYPPMELKYPILKNRVDQRT